MRSSVLHNKRAGILLESNLVEIKYFLSEHMISYNAGSFTSNRVLFGVLRHSLHAQKLRSLAPRDQLWSSSTLYTLIIKGRGRHINVYTLNIQLALPEAL